MAEHTALADTLAALEAWVDALERAGDNPDLLEAAAVPPGSGPGSAAGPVRWPASPHDPGFARAHRLGERMLALEARLAAERAEVGRALAGLTVPSSRPARAPLFFDAAL